MCVYDQCFFSSPRGAAALYGSITPGPTTIKGNFLVVHLIKEQAGTRTSMRTVLF